MKVFLAGTKTCKEIRRQSLYCLDSFFELNENKPSDCAQFEDYLLDSGAFTFMNGYKDIDKINWDEYVRRLGTYVKKNQIKHYFELDIDCIVGYDKVKQYRKTLEDIVGWQSIPVFHLSRGKDEYIRICEEYDYIAYGGLVGNKTARNREAAMLPLFIDEAHRHGTRIHGLGFTSTNKLPYIRFDSIDSTTWLSGGKYGILARFDGRRIVQLNRRPDQICKLGSKDRFLVNGDAWLKYQKYAKEHL